MSAIDLLLDEENELSFQLNIEGTQPGQAVCRLAIDNSDIGLLFEGRGSRSGEISVILPPLGHVLKEGEYDMTLEVIVDDKFFTPLTVKGNFEKSVSVTAESIVRSTPRKKTTVSARPIVENKSKSTVTSNISETKRTKPNATSDEDIMKLINALTNVSKSKGKK